MTSNDDQPAELSVVDRSIVPVLTGSSSKDDDDTPSRRQGISAQVERTHRLYGTSLLHAATRLQKLNASTYATACTIFHRFYHRVFLTKYNVWSVAMASLLLATKIEDGPQQRTIRGIVLFFDHLYRKRRGYKKDDNDNKPTKNDAPPTVPSMPKLGPVWKEYYDNIVQMENQILRELGFTLYWIPDSHPHKFLWEFMRVLFDLEPVPITVTATSNKTDDGENNKEEQKTAGDEEKSEDTDNNKETRHYALAQRAWNYCNDSCRLDLCVRFDSEVITCAAIYLASRDMGLDLPMKPQPWWELFLGKNGSNGENIATVANAILGLMDYEQQNPTIMKEFLPSLVPGGSEFNDPGSFLWETRTPDGD